MPNVSIEVPDEMYAELRRRELPLEQLAQRAFAAALADVDVDANRDWIARARQRSTKRIWITTEDLMQGVDKDFEW